MFDAISEYISKHEEKLKKMDSIAQLLSEEEYQKLILRVQGIFLFNLECSYVFYIYRKYRTYEKSTI